MSLPTDVPEIAYQCRVAQSSTVHLTTGTVDGKRGTTLCGLEEHLHPADAADVTCAACRGGTGGSRTSR
jgi:hypothetical protein